MNLNLSSTAAKSNGTTLVLLAKMSPSDLCTATYYIKVLMGDIAEPWFRTFGVLLNSCGQLVPDLDILLAEGRLENLHEIAACAECYMRASGRSLPRGSIRKRIRDASYYGSPRQNIAKVEP